MKRFTGPGGAPDTGGGDPGGSAHLRPTDWAVIGLVAVAAAVIAVIPQPDPSNLDAQYYFGNALRLAEADLDPARGLREPFVWTYLAGWFALPMPSFTYWMPLTSLVLAPFLWVGLRLELDHGELVRLAQAGFIGLRLGVVVVGVQLALRLGASRRQALLTGLLLAFGGAYLLYVGETDSFALFGLCVSGAFWFGSQPGAPYRALALAGLLAGLAHLARNDGLLVLGVLAVAQAIWARRQGQPPPSTAARLACLLAGYGLVMGPWFARQYALTGTPLTSGVSQALLMVRYTDLFVVRQTTSLADVLAHWPLVIEARYEALVSLLTVSVMMVGMGLALPLGGWGLWLRRHDRLAQLFIGYALALCLSMVLIFGWIAARGAILHSAYALQPMIAACAPFGLTRALTWLGQRRRWPVADLAQRQVVYPWALVLASAASALVLVVPLYLPITEPTQRDVYTQIARGLPRSRGELPIVAVTDPVGWHYFSGGQAIVQPGGRPADVEAALDFYQVRYIVVGPEHVAHWAALYEAPESDARYRLHAQYTGPDDQPIRVFVRLATDP